MVLQAVKLEKRLQSISESNATIKELLTRAAQESGFCEEMIQNHDERPTNSFLYNLVMDTYSFGYNASFCRYAYQPQSVPGTVRYDQEDRR